MTVAGHDVIVVGAGLAGAAAAARLAAAGCRVLVLEGQDRNGGRAHLRRFAGDQAGWFEGAVISGEDAADAILSRL